MAFGSKNTIRSVMVGEFEDHISPETDRASKRVQSDMDRMAKSAKGFIAAVAGIVAIREIKQIFTELVNFASEHQTAVTGQITKMKSAYNAFMTGIVESPLFRTLLERVTQALNFAAVLLQNTAAWDSFLTFLEARWKLFIFGKHEEFIQIFNPFADDFDISDPATKAYKEAADKASSTFAKVVQEGIKNLKISLPTATLAASVDQTVIPKLERDLAQLGDRYTALHLQQQQAPIIDGELIVRELTLAEQKLIEFELRYKETLENTNQAAYDILVNGIAQSFEAVGAAMYRNQSALGAFARSMIATAGQIASAYGDLFIKMGIPLLFVNPAQGTAMIAAGIALKILAGYLGAKASAGSTSGSTGGSAPAPRDYSTDRPSAGKKTGDTFVYVTVTNNSLDPDGFNEKRFREMAYKVFKSGSDQANRFDRTGKV